ncbi:MAG: TonB-dependent receptor [Verrucomicrobia bacterium]|nr:TonB-dependent receptor [Verrucomicrobiota bacterium]
MTACATALLSRFRPVCVGGWIGLCWGALGLVGQPAPLSLPGVDVQGMRVANEEPVGTFAMPVSALRFEPLVDVQSRNLAEGQADVAIRAGLFEQTGFRIGVLPLFDPQTGHYFAELPLPPEVLSRPQVLTGVAHALAGWNAGAGTVAYGWKPIRRSRTVQVAAGEDHTRRASWYEGWTTATRGGATLGADLSFATSRSAGSVPLGDHDFRRVHGRVQRRAQSAQTDLFAGYQAKFFGWPNLYTPFNSAESENLQTVLLALNHREDWGGDDGIEFGAYYRRNKDDYAFNRFAPLGPVHPFQHTTWVRAAAAEVRHTWAGARWRARAVVLGDRLVSSSLTAGRYRDRLHRTLALAPEWRGVRPGGGSWEARLGATYDDTNRDGSAWSPLAEVVLDRGALVSGPQRLHLGYGFSTQTATYTALNAATGAGLFRGNPNLGRQTARTLEAGVAGVAAGWIGNLTVFQRWDDALVDWTYRRGVTARTASAVDLGTTGAEAVFRRSVDRWDFVLGLTAYARRSDYRGAAVDASFYALNFPRLRATAAVVARVGRGWEVRLDNEVRRQEANLLRRSARRNAFLSSGSVSFTPPAFRDFSFALQAENLWNDAFEEVPAVPAARRQVVFSVTYRR